MLALALVWVPTAAAAEAAPTPAQQAAAIPTPSCSEGPAREGEVIVGSGCADRIVVPPTVTYVDGGPGDDTIVGSLTTAASGSCATGCHLEVGSQIFEGGPGDDLVYGDRGNDILRGNEGDDRLYGGIGDDRLEGGAGNDWLSGGFGADTIDGQEGSDHVRGDGTIDHIFDTGLAGPDTLSFATGVTPGFGAGIATGVSGFPGAKGGERGVYLHLGDGGEDAANGIAASGGGVDVVQPGAFERFVGTPFSDYIVGTVAAEEILGGGGADVIEGGGGVDVVRGGADGDYLEAAPNSGSTLVGGAGTDGCVGTGDTTVECEGTTKAVHLRAATTVSIGETDGGSGSTAVYVVGGSGAETITATYSQLAVAVTLGSGSFNAEASDVGGCTITDSTHASCPLAAPATPNVPALDALTIAGMGGGDIVTAANFPDGTGVMLLGGAGTDHLTGGPSEDTLVDDPPETPSADTLEAGAGDDALLHDGGLDLLEGGEGSDLFLSVSVCDGEQIAGGPSVGSDRDNSSWARLGGGGVFADIETGVVGRVAGEAPTCPTGTADKLEGIEDLEGSEGSDVLIGNAANNQLLGHRGEDAYRALGGDDSILANSGTRDRVIDCGEGSDSAVVDLAAVGDPVPIGCERLREGVANEFQLEIEQPLPAPVTPPVVPPPAPPPPTKPDRTAPRTKLLHRPPPIVRVAPRHRAAAIFRFGASESSRFECKLDAKPFRRCRSPLRTRLAIGRHSFKVVAIDAAGNRDKTPALAHIRVLPRRPARAPQ